MRGKVVKMLSQNGCTNIISHFIICYLFSDDYYMLVCNLLICYVVVIIWTLAVLFPCWQKLWCIRKSLCTVH